MIDQGVILATTYHDPEGRLYEQVLRTMPTLTTIFQGIALTATAQAPDHVLSVLAEQQVAIEREDPERGAKIGLARRDAVELALRFDASFILYCDFDRILHWIEAYPEELAGIVSQISAYDFTVLGRTERAFASHPKVQRDTEAIINYVYATVSGNDWDVTAAARGLSRSCAQAIVEGCTEETLGTDVAWPLYVQNTRSFTLGSIATDRLEFETQDRHPTEIAAAGDTTKWLAQLDADPRRWLQRVKLAATEIEAIIRYSS